ncbi:hypothetical protein [Peribacillus sp. SCS-37]|uniref:hypothetical protein n=1 Tax=Paraperibacillus esterisolvens TaxID=3115296 RepID=UPI0039065322
MSYDIEPDMESPRVIQKVKKKKTYKKATECIRLVDVQDDRTKVIVWVIMKGEEVEALAK